jgi:transposase InsO family protein
MPWEEVTRMSLRQEFVQLAMQPGANRRELCRRFKISPKTAYKWLGRYKLAGQEGLEDRSRRPHRSPGRTNQATEQEVISVRAESLNCWGGRKLSRRLIERGGSKLAPSTITKILHRHGLIEPERSAAATPWQRFERGIPNELWQMDFKGHFALVDGRRCHPLTVLDDHSRFALLLEACADERRDSVQTALTAAFRRCGLPGTMLMDNGPPWGYSQENSWTALGLWLVRLGIRVIHGRAYHPQTQGKDERFHRTLKFELLRHFNFTSLEHCQREFDRFRNRYNLERPHDALGLETPASRYRISPIPFPETLPPIEYPAGLEVRKVQSDGRFNYRGHEFQVTKALRGLSIALRPAPDIDEQRELLFCHQVIARIDLQHGDISYAQAKNP